MKDFDRISIVASSVKTPRSIVSGLEDEVDEWEAIQKLTLLRDYETRQKRKEDNFQSKMRLKAELDKQN